MSDESKPPPLDLPPSLRPNTRLEMDGLTFLAALPEACFPVAFFDPQFRGLYDKLKYGNEGVSRHRRRAQLDAMDQDTIARFIEGIERALRPTGHLFLWVDKFHLMEGITPWIKNTQLQVVDMITWDKRRMGLGYRSRSSAEYCIVLQKPPRKAKGVWTDRSITDVQWDPPPKSPHPHAKPVDLQAKLIAAVTNKGDYVIDPAAGSFSVLEAALQNDRMFLGCDIRVEKQEEPSQMPNRNDRTTEFDMSVAVLRILNARADGVASLDDLREAMPEVIELTDGDREYSETRPGEQKWEQILRNITSHTNRSPNNFITRGLLRSVDGGGYAITDAGRELLASLEP